MFDNEKLKKLTPLVEVFLKSKGIDLKNINVSEVLAQYEKYFGKTEVKTETKEEEIVFDFSKKDDDSSIKFSLDKEDDEIYYITVELAGYDKTNTTVEVANSIVTINASRSSEFNTTKTVCLKNEDDEIVASTMINGLLRITVKQFIIIKSKQIIID